MTKPYKKECKPIQTEIDLRTCDPGKFDPAKPVNLQPALVS